MGLADFFRPKYRHSDVRVRLEAVRALSSDEADILTTVARNDKDASVRRVAIEKLETVEVLAELAASESDRANRDLAGARAAELWVSSACQGEDDILAEAALAGLLKLGDDHALVEVATRAAKPELRKRAAGAIKDARALAELARQAASPELRQAVLARLDDVEALRALAIDTNVKELGLAALEKLDGKDLLEHIANKAKAKAVRQRARKRLDDMAAAEAAARPKEADAIRRARAEKAQWVRAVEALAETFDFDKAGPELAKAEQAWQALADTGEAGTGGADERFARAVQRFHARREVAALALAQRHEQVTRRDEPVVERAPRRERERDPDDVDIVNPVHGDVLNRRPAAVTPEDDAARAARQQEAAERRAARDAERAEQDAARAREQAERATRQQEAAERGVALARSLAAMVDELEAVASAPGGDGRAMDRLLGQAATAFGQLVKVAPAERDALEARYVAVRGRLVARAQEMREGEDWKRWANVPRAEALVAAAKELAEREEAPTIPVLKTVQQAWKELGPMPSKKSKELWDQFKSHCDAAFARIRTSRDAENEKLAGNVAAKEALIVQAEALADSTDWEVTAIAMKELQKRWKDAGPVPRKAGDELWKRFRAACDRFFERRKPILDAAFGAEQDNLARKERLIADAEQVVARAPGEAGWGKAIGEIKDLQRAWQEVGRVPRADVEPLWQRFRAACDALFAKRDAARDAEADARRAELDGVRAELEAVLAGGDDVVPRALAARARLAALAEGDLEPGAELRALADRMVREVMATQAEALRGTELDPVAMASRRAKLIDQVERLLPRALPTVAAGSSPAEIAQKLKEAMAGNALWKGDGRDPIEVVDELRARWREVGPVVGDDAEAAVARFEAAVARVRELHGRDDSDRGRDDRARDDRGRGDRGPRGARDDRGGDRPRADAGGRRERRERRRDEGARSTSDAMIGGEPAEVAPAPVAIATALAIEVAEAPPSRRSAEAEVAQPVAALIDVAEPDPPMPKPDEPVRPARARTTTLPPGVVERMDDEWDAAGDDAPAPAVAADAPAAPAAPADAPKADAVIDSGWE